MVCFVNNTVESSAKSKDSLRKVVKAKTKPSKAMAECLVKEKKRFLIEHEFNALKELLPTSDEVTSPLEVVLEAIGYIQRLENQLAQKDPSLCNLRLKMDFLSKQSFQS